MINSRPISIVDLPAIKEALKGTFISQVRITSPGTVFSADYNQHRLWIKTDDEGVVRDVTLG